MFDVIIMEWWLICISLIVTHSIKVHILRESRAHLPITVHMSILHISYILEIHINFNLFLECHVMCTETNFFFLIKCTIHMYIYSTQ